MTQAARSEPCSEIVYDDSRWPFVVVTMPPGTLTDQQLTDHLDKIDSYTRRGGRYAFVMDARVADPPNASQRRRIVEAMDKNGKRDGARFIGVVVVLSSAAGRAVFKALLWLRQERMPMSTTATVEEGLKWLRAIEADTAAR